MQNKQRKYSLLRLPKCYWRVRRRLASSYRVNAMREKIAWHIWNSGDQQHDTDLAYCKSIDAAGGTAASPWFAGCLTDGKDNDSSSTGCHGS
jgi:hypothetical protein